MLQTGPMSWVSMIQQEPLPQLSNDDIVTAVWAGVQQGGAGGARSWLKEERATT